MTTILPETLKSMLLQCRAGLENDCAAEIQDRAARHGIAGFCRARADTGYVIFETYESGQIAQLMQRLSFRELVFARQWFGVVAELTDLPAADRAGPIVAALPETPLGTLHLEYPDTNEGKALSGFCRKFERPLRQRLARAGLLRDDGEDAADALRLHVFFLDSSHAWLGLASPHNSAQWPLGIPRLRMPHEAPSRSTLKLEEAFLVFLDEQERARRLRPGQRAIDLGAAPGGWTYQLVRRGLRVTAVDNGPMAPSLMATGLVEHLRADGFSYRPRQAVDWLVCDMVEQPTRVAALIGDYFAGEHCREAIFNLKLPMKKRYQAVTECLELLAQALERTHVQYHIACKQLYHDREEVTVHVRAA